MKIAYLINQYPKVSHSFIRREILALERQGFEVQRIALRGWADHLVDAEDLRERDKTRYLLRDGALALALSTLGALIKSPGRFFGALALAMRMARRADRPWPLHLIYLAEACRMLGWLRPCRARRRHLRHDAAAGVREPRPLRRRLVPVRVRLPVVRLREGRRVQQNHAVVDAAAVAVLGEGREVADALQADVELGMLEHQLVAASRTRSELQARLRALLHDETERALPDPPRELPMIEHQLADTTFAAAAARRPELRARDAEVEARRAEIDAAGRTRFPELLLHARYDRAMDTPEWRTMVGAGVTLPLGLERSGARVRAARADLARVQAERLALADSIRVQVEIARARYRESTHELEIIESRIVPATERALASVRAGYETNRSDFFAFLTAERDLARARLDRYQAVAMVHLALADLERAIGAEPASLEEESR